MAKKIVILVVIAVVVVGIVAWSLSGGIPVTTQKPQVLTLRQYIVEEGETRLAEEYWISMPIAGRVKRITLTEGAPVTKGKPVAWIDDLEVRQQCKGCQAQIAEIRARMLGIPLARAKPEDIAAAELRVKEAELKIGVAQKKVAIAEEQRAKAEREYDRAKKLHPDNDRNKADRPANMISDAEFDRAEQQYKELLAIVAHSRLQVMLAETERNLAGVSLERIKRYREDNAYELDAMAARVDQIQSNLAILQDQLNKTKITSPINGIVLEKRVESERVLPAGTRLMLLGRLDTIEIETDILSEEVTRIREGQTVEITGKALAGRTLEGKVKRIYPKGFEKISSLGIEQQRVKVLVAFDNSELKLRPGVSVDVAVVIAERPRALCVPESAVFKRQGKWHVFVANGKRAVLKAVTVGIRNDRFVQITDGLSAEDAVILDPPSDLAPGAAVKPAQQTPLATTRPDR